MKNYATATNVDEGIVYKYPQELLPVSQEAMPAVGYAYALQQKVADSFFKAGVIPVKVDIK